MRDKVLAGTRWAACDCVSRPEGTLQWSAGGVSCHRVVCKHRGPFIFDWAASDSSACIHYDTDYVM